MMTPHMEQGVYVIGVDGGTATLGLSVYQYKVDNPHLLATYPIKATGLAVQYEYIVERADELSARIKEIKDTLISYIKSLPYKISLMVYESPFINPRRPTAVIPLARVLQIFIEVCYELGISFLTITPQEMKRHVEVKKTLAKAGKDDVKVAINQLIQAKKITTDLSLEGLTEHEIDSIGIGYVGYQKYFKSILDYNPNYDDVSKGKNR